MFGGEKRTFSLPCYDLDGNCLLARIAQQGCAMESRIKGARGQRLDSSSLTGGLWWRTRGQQPEDRSSKARASHERWEKATVRGRFHLVPPNVNFLVCNMERPHSDYWVLCDPRTGFAMCHVIQQQRWNETEHTEQFVFLKGCSVVHIGKNPSWCS